MPSITLRYFTEAHHKNAIHPFFGYEFSRTEGSIHFCYRNLQNAPMGLKSCVESIKKKLKTSICSRPNPRISVDGLRPIKAETH